MKRSIIFLFLLLILVGIGGYYLYNIVYGPAVKASSSNRYLYIPSDSDFQAVTQNLYQSGFLSDTTNFKRLANWMNYPAHVYPGRYRLEKGISLHKLIIKLRSANKTPISLTLSPFRNIESLAGYVNARLEADSARIVQLMNKEDVLQQFNLDRENRLCLFIPDTYEFEWNTEAMGFLKQMHKHYKNFWTIQRKAKAKQQELTPKEVMTLASIVQEESNRIREWDTIAGVYLNRLNKANMRLQADPTLKYILEERGKENIQRIYKKHFKLNSPYNTYKNDGLPPGPIGMPETQAIKAVLNPVEHDYLYFVAKPNGKGSHNFSKTLRQHNRYARKYRQHLDKESIY